MASKVTPKLFHAETELANQVKVTVIDSLSNHLDYGEDRFKCLPINRSIKRANELKLLRAFKNVHPNGVSVLTVIYTGAFDNGVKHYYLCDGHHRRKVALELSGKIGTTVGLTFNIIEIDGEDTIENVGKVLETINVNLGTWSPKDFTSHISKLGLEVSKDYAKFEQLSEMYGLGESDMLQILGLGNFTMAQFKAKEFKIENLSKSEAILDVIRRIGLNNPKQNKHDGFPHTYVKRALLKKLTSLDKSKVIKSTQKFQKFLKEESFSYDEAEFREQLDNILKSA